MLSIVDVYLQYNHYIQQIYQNMLFVGLLRPLCRHVRLLGELKVTLSTCGIIMLTCNTKFSSCPLWVRKAKRGLLAFWDQNIVFWGTYI